MNIFLDTNILYKDPYLRGNYYSKLLKFIENKEINFFISEIVYKELERNYSKIASETNQKLNKIKGESEHYKFQGFKVDNVNIEESLKEFHKFYKKLITDKLLTILPVDKELFSTIIDKAIVKSKPFSQGKTELKDAIIWLTYSGYAENNNLRNCYLLTENVNDFANLDKLKKENVLELHPDLLKECSRIVLYKSVKELIEEEAVRFSKINERFNIWVKNQNINDDFVLSILKSEFEKNIIRRIENEIMDVDLNGIFESEFFLDGYVTSGNFDLNYIENLNITLFDDECIISGDLFVYTEAQAYIYNPMRDTGEDTYSYYGETNLIIKVSFSFFYDRSKLPISFEIENVEID